MEISPSSSKSVKLHGMIRAGTTLGTAHPGPEQVQRSGEYILHTREDGTLKLFCENGI